MSENVNLKDPRRIEPAYWANQRAERWCVSAGLSSDAGERRTTCSQHTGMQRSWKATGGFR